MKIKDFDVSAAERAWQTFQRNIGVAAIHTPQEYKRTVELTNRLLDVVGEDESHPLAGLLDLVGELLSAYEAREVPVPDASPGEVLQLLMEQNGLAQTDLRAELGGQPVVSEVLNGKRRINARQAKALAARFNVSPASFI
jgi:HTH-type transcriptional regulator/antitoxin HigA